MYEGILNDPQTVGEQRGLPSKTAMRPSWLRVWEVLEAEGHQLVRK